MQWWAASARGWVNTRQHWQHIRAADRSGAVGRVRRSPCNERFCHGRRQGEDGGEELHLSRLRHERASFDDASTSRAPRALYPSVPYDATKKLRRRTPYEKFLNNAVFSFLRAARSYVVRSRGPQLFRELREHFLRCSTLFLCQAAKINRASPKALSPPDCGSNVLE